MMMLSFMFEICESCTFENDIRQSNSISVLVFAGRNSDAILNTDVGGQGYRTSGQLCLVLVRSERQTPDSIF